MQNGLYSLKSIIKTYNNSIQRTFSAAFAAPKAADFGCYKKMKNKQIIKFGIFVLLMLPFSMVKGQSENNINIEEKLKNLPQKDRAFLQQEIADLVIDFYTWEDISCNKPEVTDRKYSKSLTKEEFLTLLKEKSISRNLAVVIMDKRDSPDQNIEEIEKFLKEQRFQKVIFQQAHSDWCETGLPIIKE